MLLDGAGPGGGQRGQGHRLQVVAQRDTDDWEVGGQREDREQGQEVVQHVHKIIADRIQRTPKNKLWGFFAGYSFCFV